MDPQRRTFQRYVQRHGGRLLSQRRAEFATPAAVDKFLDDLEIDDPMAALRVHVQGTTVQFKESTVSKAEGLVELLLNEKRPLAEAVCPPAIVKAAQAANARLSSVRFLRGGGLEVMVLPSGGKPFAVEVYPDTLEYHAEVERVLDPSGTAARRRFVDYMDRQRWYLV